MLKKRSLILVVLFIVCHLAINRETYASDKFGVIYDMQGKVQLKSASGKTTILKRERDILRSVNEGDRIEVLGVGKTVVVSLKEKKGYEIGADSEVLIKDMKVAAVKGQIKTLEGLHVPTDDFLETGNKGGAAVLRGVESCIKAVSPVNTTILELSPELKWKNECEGAKKVTVTILSRGKKVFNDQTYIGSLIVPDGVLKYGYEYDWLIDGGSATRQGSGRFSIPGENDVKTLREKMAYYKGQGRDLPQRLSYLFFLLDNNLNEMAKAEIEKLKSEFSENEYLIRIFAGISPAGTPPKASALAKEKDAVDEKAKKNVGSQPSKDPILRIETGMHIARIRRIGVDAENRYLVTGSDDKTVRIWDLPTGRLLRTVRIPIGEGNEGTVYALAITPDGKTIACGGWTGYERDKSIYLFDRETGDLIRRISGLPQVIDHLAYSKDGKLLVACLGGNNGIRVYRTSDYSQITEDRDYGSDSYGADFDIRGRLVTTSYDGYIRLYSEDFKLIAKEKTRGGSQPSSVGFSPDMTVDDVKIAVGFSDSTKVDVYSGKDLSYLYSPDTTGTNWSLGSVAWSSDGGSLYAGGQYSYKYFKDPISIRKWTDKGKGSYRDISAANDTIGHILPLDQTFDKGGQGIVFGAADPSFGIINSKGERVIFKGPSTANFRNNSEGFLISNDGFTVRFGYEVGGKSPAHFSVIDGLLGTEQAAGSLRLSAPVAKAEGLEITDWKSTYTPKLNGSPLKLQKYEQSRCLAISPDMRDFLLGTAWYLHLFDRSGIEKWQVPAPGTTWGVNISGNGNVAVAAFGDGTIRWYRMTDGKELLAFFPHKDQKRWVVWTPSGYYTSSPGADEIIGWHINNGKDSAADFFPISKFRSTYYRPDVIAKVLDTLDEKEALKLADKESGRKREEMPVQKMLPPVVIILSPSGGTEVSSTEVTIRYSIRTPSGEAVTGVKALVNGRPVPAERKVVSVSKDSDIQEMKVIIPESDSEVSIIAENRYSASDPATTLIKWKGRTQKDEFIIKPKLYVLSVGVSKYENKDLTLVFSAKDARDIAAALLKQKGGLYRDVIVKVLTDEKATKDEVVDGLDWLQKETTSKDVAIVFLSGHGVHDHTGIYHYLPSNADPEKLKRTGIPFTDINNTVASLAGKVLLFIDTCHSGDIMGKRKGMNDITRVINELTSAENGAVVFASSTGSQYSLEDPAWGNGAFTKALIEGINGKADYMGKGKITINMLDLYLSERVKELTKGKQTPTTTKPNTVPDFPVAVKQ